MRYIIIALLALSSISCTTTATLSEDGRTMTLEGLMGSKAKFKDGSEISKDSFLKIPDLPSLKVDY